MKITDYNEYITIEEIRDFDIEQTLLCGQCFHFEKIADKEYGICAFDKLLHIKQEGDKLLLLNVREKEEVSFWLEYLDLYRDYGIIKESLLKKDKKLEEAINDKWGVRILNQEFSETLMSFIISQNKQIPHIKKIVHDISKEYGEYLGEISGISFYSFPDIFKLQEIKESDYKELKTGFRAPYLKNASYVLKNCAEKVVDLGANDLPNRISMDKLIKENIFNCNYEEALLFLKEIKGVGDKVANCVLLFSLGYRASFPVDVWIKRLMEEMYFEGKDTRKEEISNLATKLYGEYAGYAQQYIFFHGRDNK